MNILFVFVLILFAAFSRLIPHAPNFTPVISMALFAGTYLKNRFAFLVPILALFISDAIIGFYGTLMIFVYGSLGIIVVVSLLMRGRVSTSKVFGFSLVGALCFFIITNFGVWILPSSMYPKTFAGLLLCYEMALPFFRNTIFSTLIYSAVMFGAYEMAEKYVHRMRVV
ncbi:MAG: hypothetical protein QMD50_03770 [Patescibacteria group bacterium]|nr:hypothetical protein [Patescibacteria group bacterium]